MKRSNCVVFGVTPNIFFSVATTIIGLEKYSSQYIDTYVIFYEKDEPIPEIDKDAIYKITQKIVFKEYQPPKNFYISDYAIVVTKKYTWQSSKYFLY